MSEQISFETIGEGNLIYGREDKSDFVVSDPSALASLYSKMYPSCPIPEEKPRPPKIDFSKEMVVGVFKGVCPSGGYSITIIDIKRNDEGD